MLLIATVVYQLTYPQYHLDLEQMPIMYTHNVLDFSSDADGGLHLKVTVVTSHFG